MTQKTKHTPGPWVVENGLQVWKSGHNTVESPRICTFKNAALPVEQISYVEMEANARLIAAAPDLLEALKEIEKWYDAIENRPSLCGLGHEKYGKEELPKIIRAAIAKAMGE